jgi:hypothetical protein
MSSFNKSSGHFLTWQQFTMKQIDKNEVNEARGIYLTNYGV